MSFQRPLAKGSLKGVRSGLVDSTSTGSCQLDPILGGGLPLGSVTLLAEDVHNVYGKLLMKAFIAEGIVHDHEIVTIFGETPLDLNELPRKVPKEAKSSSQSSDEMKIAFRYERLPEHQSLPESQANYVFDFGLTIDPDQLRTAKIRNIDSVRVPADEILKLVTALASSSSSSSSSSSNSSSNVVRVVVTLGLLLDHRFLRALKIISRHDNVVCWVSVPHCVSSEKFQRLFAIGDTVISLVAFSGDERQANALYKKHHGLLNIDKIAEINSLSGHKPRCVEYAFHQSSKRFAIEQLHMPPDLGENPPLSMSCQTAAAAAAGSRQLDF